MRCLCFSITLCVQQSPSEWLAGIRIEKFTPRYFQQLQLSLLLFDFAQFWWHFSWWSCVSGQPPIIDHQHSNYCFGPSGKERKKCLLEFFLGSIVINPLVSCKEPTTEDLESYHGNLWLSHFCGIIMLCFSYDNSMHENNLNKYTECPTSFKNIRNRKRIWTSRQALKTLICRTGHFNFFNAL